MNITLIGAGRLAYQLGKSLSKAGHKITEVYSRTETSAKALADLLETTYCCDLSKVSRDSDVYVFALKDSALEQVASQICPTIGEALAIHTAGSMPMELFKGKARHYGVLYPMQTFSKERNVDFTDIPCFIEASDEASESKIRQMLEGVSQLIIKMDTDRRKKLHLAAVFACNFSNHCYAMAEKILKSEGIDFNVMLPLIDETARKVHDLSPAKAQTGPAVRWDENVIQNQSNQLEGIDRDIYMLMSESIHRNLKT